MTPIVQSLLQCAIQNQDPELEYCAKLLALAAGSQTPASTLTDDTLRAMHTLYREREIEITRVKTISDNHTHTITSHIVYTESGRIVMYEGSCDCPDCLEHQFKDVGDVIDFLMGSFASAKLAGAYAPPRALP